MRYRRPIAALLTTLALFGGGATLTGCTAAGQQVREDEGVPDYQRDDLPNLHDPVPEQNLDDDRIPPD